MTAQPRCCRWREEERHCREALPRGETAASGTRPGPCAACRGEAPDPAHAARADVTCMQIRWSVGRGGWRR